MPEMPAREPGEYLTDRLNSEAVTLSNETGNALLSLPRALCCAHRAGGKAGRFDKSMSVNRCWQKQNNPVLAAMIGERRGVGHIMRTLDEWSQ